jgi:transcriptional regulator with XRE-family HTH domain
MGSGSAPASFGQRLKARRATLGLSQLQLAVDADVSPRHLSFIETGRSRPSREMVLRLAEQLRVPLREQNLLLLAAGFAPEFAQHELHEPELSAVRDAAALVLENHEPFPAVALDRRRDIVMSNRAAPWLLEGLPPALLGPPLNIYRLLLHPDGLARRIVDFAADGYPLLARLRRDAETSGDAELHALAAELAGYPGLATHATPSPAGAALQLRLRDGARELAFVATLATFGTPFDVTVSELVIECLFPVDDYTAARCRVLGGARATPQE